MGFQDDLEKLRSHSGDTYVRYLAEALERSQEFREDYAARINVVKHDQMPFERSPDGLIKHIVHENMNTKECCIEIYMQFLDPGIATGKHRHLSGEIAFVVEGRGHDLHWDVKFDCAGVAPAARPQERHVQSAPSRREPEPVAPFSVLAHEVGHHANLDTTWAAQFRHPWQRELWRRLGVGTGDETVGHSPAARAERHSVLLWSLQPGVAFASGQPTPSAGSIRRLVLWIIVLLVEQRAVTHVAVRQSSTCSPIARGLHSPFYGPVSRPTGRSGRCVASCPDPGPLRLHVLTLLSASPSPTFRVSQHGQLERFLTTSQRE